MSPRGRRGADDVDVVLTLSRFRCVNVRFTCPTFGVCFKLRVFESQGYGVNAFREGFNLEHVNFIIPVSNITFVVGLE
ncbi:hypothetical protein G9C98_000397 [Cotesia typhae]|uniref:Uncharacterized protein n=1 Tax=Cotesia typhae TaxID=2053667 RepID=A0A8J5R6A0_9HYME|nr:hypothetical protein G9C98_000397 [Cotesia typhae]